MTPLAAALLILLSFSPILGGRAYYVPHIRAKADPEAYVQTVANEIERAAKLSGISAWLLGSLLYEESRLNEDAVSWTGSSIGIAQLHKRGRHFRAWIHACRAVPSECRFAAIREGARALRDGLDACGSQVRAIKFYRSGHCARPRPRDRAVARLAARIRALMGGKA